MKKEGILYKRLPNGRAECDLCARRCKIGEGQKGFCGIRQNINGSIYLIAYGNLAALNIDPIEKKPRFHVKPGASMLSVGTVGCNFNCLYCQNWDISRERNIGSKEIMPDYLVELGIQYAVDGITYTYNEPTIFMEYAMDVARISKKRGMFNTFVTNGYMTPEAVDAAAGLIDAMTVDFKGNANDKFAQKYIAIPSEEPIFESLKELKKKKIFVEITDLVVPKFGDSIDDARKLARWIYDNMGPDVPLHFLRFHPDYKMLDIPMTPVKTLEKHYAVAKEAGINYVYLGNVPGHKYENTYCPECGELLIKRFIFDIIEYRITDEGKCPKCGAKINIERKPSRSFKTPNEEGIV